ncbi:hypothetical protein ALC62_01655 [Cyphomyrmex costatus]|uniref:Uncharacterized protein n=1 Tax=Cyphomyrmex costatus TaxID=456900 RepID=A0A195D3H4_9HYME|nr:hypothetical protein ALC62_01655 [Cyphomyrmex costatus]
MGQGALRKQSVQSGYSLDERRRMDSASHSFRSQYIPCTDLRYRVAHKYRVHCIRSFKAFPIRSSNCESQKIQRCNLSLRYFRNETYRTNEAIRI